MAESTLTINLCNMKTIFLLTVLFLCAGCGMKSSKDAQTGDVYQETAVTPPSTIELIKEISQEAEQISEAIQGKYGSNYGPEFEKFVQERNTRIADLLERINGKDISFDAEPDSLFEITGAKVKRYVQYKNQCYIMLTFSVRLKKDFVPRFYYAPFTGKPTTPQMPKLYIRCCNSQGKSIESTYKSLFDQEEAMGKVSPGEVYAKAGYECSDLEPGISFEISPGQRLTDFTSIKLSIVH